MPSQCKICGKENCTEHYLPLGKIKINKFSGSSPPEIFVGKWNYPNVFTGILSPENYGNTQIMSSPELWHENKLSISEIIKFRNQLIYGRTQSNIKKLQTKFLSVLHEVAMTHKSIAAEFKLKKPISRNPEKEDRVAIIPKAAQVEQVRLQENTKIKRKVDYLVNDTDVKSAIAVQELDKSKIPTSNIIKIFSAGLLGIKKNRKLVPTRWSITTVDSTLSENKLKSIRYYNTISEIQLFYADYIGLHFEFLLLPEKYSFEMIETNWSSGLKFWHDYETFFPRKKYAKSVAGAYYCTRLALTEYFEKIKKQGQCLAILEERPQYYASCGVGVHRQTAREAFSEKPEAFQTITEALNKMQSRLKLPIENYIQRSWLLKNYGKQKRITDFIS